MANRISPRPRLGLPTASPISPEPGLPGVAAVAVEAGVEAGAQGRAKALLLLAAVRLLMRLHHPQLDLQKVDLQKVDLPQPGRKAEVEAEVVRRQRPPTGLRSQHSSTSGRAFPALCRRSRLGAWKS
jgi:hypothetical protein